MNTRSSCRASSGTSTRTTSGGEESFFLSQSLCIFVITKYVQKVVKVEVKIISFTSTFTTVWTYSAREYSIKQRLDSVLCENIMFSTRERIESNVRKEKTKKDKNNLQS